MTSRQVLPMRKYLLITIVGRQLFHGPLCTYECLTGKALTALHSGPSFQGCLYKKLPWKIEIISPSGARSWCAPLENTVSPSRAKGRHAY